VVGFYVQDRNVRITVAVKAPMRLERHRTHRIENWYQFLCHKMRKTFVVNLGERLIRQRYHQVRFWPARRS